VIEYGTNLDSFKFHWRLADHLDVNGHNVHGYFVGEHGDYFIPIWSTINVCGMLNLFLLFYHSFYIIKKLIKKYHQIKIKVQM